jgi:hypothetical protein
VGDRWVDRLRARGIAFAERVTSFGPMRPIAEVGWLAARRDASVGRTVLAGRSRTHLHLRTNLLQPFELLRPACRT